jgi:SAM-dependent methyltransferase
MNMPDQQLRLYRELAKWWPLFSPPIHYDEEAADLLPTLLSTTNERPSTLLELGCGGGSLAWHFKAHFTLTLTDRSSDMLAVSRSVNPECEHLLGDMRTLDLVRQFDLVLVHDAIMYMTEPADVHATLNTAFRHCRPGGAALFIPDHVKETFEPRTGSGGDDADDGRGLRYVEWSWDPDPSDNTFEAAYAFVLRDSDGTVAFDGDRHREGLFPRAAWLAWMTDAGFSASSRIDPWNRDVFVGKKPA